MAIIGRQVVAATARRVETIGHPVVAVTARRAEIIGPRAVVTIARQAETIGHPAAGTTRLHRAAVVLQARADSARASPISSVRNPSPQANRSQG